MGVGTTAGVATKCHSYNFPAKEITKLETNGTHQAVKEKYPYLQKLEV